MSNESSVLRHLGALRSVSLSTDLETVGAEVRSKVNEDDQHEREGEEMKMSSTNPKAKVVTVVGRGGTHAGRLPNRRKSSSPKTYCCSSSSVYETEWSSTGLLKQSVFDARLKNILMDPNGKAADRVGCDWTIKYVGNMLQNQSGGFALPNEIGNTIRQVAAVPDSRQDKDLPGLYQQQNQVVKEWLFAYMCYALRLPVAKANANAQLLSFQDVLPKLNEYMSGKSKEYTLICE
jgi:hypothetical protein